MPEEETKVEGTEKKGKGKMTLAVVGALMLLEAAGVYFVVGVLGGPSAASASEMAGLEQLDREAPVEILLVEDRFQNLDSGRVWGWHAEIYMKVRQKNTADVERILERDEAEIREGVALIFRRARDRHLREPGMETITRQTTAYVTEVFGADADGLPIVDRVIFAKLKGAPEDI